MSLAGHRRIEPGTEVILAIRLGFAKLPHFEQLLLTLYKCFTAEEGSVTVKKRNFLD